MRSTDRPNRCGHLLVAVLAIEALGCGGPSTVGRDPATDRQPRDAVTTTGPVTTTTTAAPPAWSTDMESVVAATNAFACDLYALRRASTGNVFFSPFSIHTALAMTAVGARGTTRDQLLTTLHLPDAEAAPRSGDLGRIVAATDGDVLALANALWGQSGSGWVPSFEETLTSRFAAGVEQVDFVGGPEPARERINGWVAARTQGRIGELLGPGAVTPLTRLVLTNAVAFKASWTAQFDAARTQPAPFHLEDGGTVDAPLMQRRDPSALHAAIDDFQLLVLPYVGDAHEMMIMLPREESAGLPTVEARLTAEAVSEWRAVTEPTEVDIWLPRFRMEDGFLVNEALQTLGAVDLFDLAKADLSGISSADRLVVSAVIHKAFVEVDEEGTKAVAATAVVGNLPGPPPPRPVEFRADRPFVFLIRDVRTGTILFLGRLTDPTR